MSTGAITIQLYDGARNPLAGTPEVLITIYDNRQRNRFSRYLRAGRIKVTDLEIHNDGSDQLAVIAALRGCSDGAFFPVPLAESPESEVELMLPPRHVQYDLGSATWDQLRDANKPLFNFLAGASPDQNGQLYEGLRQANRPQVACLHNITTAINLLPGQKPGEVLSFFKKITLQNLPLSSVLTEGLRQDRFFAWAEPGLEDYLAGHTDIFERVNPGLHPGADLSFKELRFGEANLQFTFHHDEKPPDGSHLVKIEMDMDFFKDTAAHFLLEVIPNELITRAKKLVNPNAGHLTDPAQIYSLRWMAGKRAGEEFAPPFTLQAA